MASRIFLGNPDHPQLGPVEIGGWRYKFIWQNPPPQLLEAEISKNTDFALTLARCLPRVRVLSSSVTPLGGGYSKVLVALRNDGWLPTNGTTQALVTASVRKAPKAELVLAGGLAIISGTQFGAFFAPHFRVTPAHVFASPLLTL